MKKEIVERFLNDKHINFDEALELMKAETVKEYILYPNNNPLPYQPYLPVIPNAPWYGQHQITC